MASKYNTFYEPCCDRKIYVYLNSEWKYQCIVNVWFFPTPIIWLHKNYKDIGKNIATLLFAYSFEPSFTRIELLTFCTFQLKEMSN